MEQILGKIQGRGVTKAQNEFLLLRRLRMPFSLCTLTKPPDLIS